MSYTVPINRAHPGLIMLLLDQSDSMNDDYGAGTGTKAQTLARLVNRLIRNLVLQCERGDELRHYYDVGVIGYGGTEARSAFGGELAGQFVVPIATVANYPLSMELEALPERPDVMLERPIWIESVGSGGTPMTEAINLAGGILVDWANENLDSFPPLVINITDGMATDGDPRQIAEQLREIHTNDGNLLFFNVHISEAGGTACEFPATSNGLPDRYAEVLFGMSSELTPYMRTVGQN
ncbi:MAG: vWA domain-containing protein, partial [Actinomycetota bacterium]